MFFKCLIMGNKWAKLDFNWIFSSFDLFLTTVYIIFNIEYKYVYRIPKGPYLEYSYNSVWLLYWLWWDETSNYFATQADIMIDIVYDLDKD